MLRLHNMSDMYFDMRGVPMSAEAFGYRYKSRVGIKTSCVLGLSISSEFVGINHESDPDARPKIFETVVSVKLKQRELLLFSHWLPSLEATERYHRRLCLAVKLGGFILFHLLALMKGVIK